MRFTSQGSVLTLAMVVTVLAAPQQPKARGLDVPSLDVPACPDVGSISYTNTVPSTDNTTFPKTEVSLCYDDASIHITFTALQEKSFYCKSDSRVPRRMQQCRLVIESLLTFVCWGHTDNASVPVNGDIYDYEVMEAFIVSICHTSSPKMSNLQLVKQVCKP